MILPFKSLPVERIACAVLAQRVRRDNITGFLVSYILSKEYMRALIPVSIFRKNGGSGSSAAPASGGSTYQTTGYEYVRGLFARWMET